MLYNNRDIALSQYYSPHLHHGVASSSSGYTMAQQMLPPPPPLLPPPLPLLLPPLPLPPLLLPLLLPLPLLSPPHSEHHLSILRPLHQKSYPLCASSSTSSYHPCASP
jgi:hypothetical protein